MHNRKFCKSTMIGTRPTYNPNQTPFLARCKLHSKIQEPGETVQQFVTALKLLVKDCEYGQAEDDIVRDRIVFGTKSAKVREKLIDIGSDLTLERAIEVARVDEVSVQQLKEMTDETEQGVHAVKKNWRHKDSKSNAATHTCGRCGRLHDDGCTWPSPKLTPSNCMSSSPISYSLLMST